MPLVTLLALLLPHPWLVVGIGLSLGTVWAISVHRPPSPVGAEQSREG
jgi:hypothetical protein